MTTGANINRTQFLRGRFKGELPQRPPWAVDESRFTDLCNRCDACISACHVKIIQRGTSGFPEINFTRSGCDFCRACVQVCDTGALDKSAVIPWQLKASFKDNCFSQRGVVCRSCSDICEQRAIRFRLAVGGRAQVELSVSNCVGCGECVSLCPAKAIEMKVIEVSQHE